MPVTRLDKVTWEEFLKLFDESVHDRLKEHWDNPDTTHMVMFENCDMWSSQMGYRTALPVGASWTLKTLDEVREQRLGETPSQFQYPTKYCEKGG